MSSLILLVIHISGSATILTTVYSPWYDASVVPVCVWAKQRLNSFCVVKQIPGIQTLPETLFSQTMPLGHFSLTTHLYTFYPFTWIPHTPTHGPPTTKESEPKHLWLLACNRISHSSNLIFWVGLYFPWNPRQLASSGLAGHVPAKAPCLSSSCHVISRKACASARLMG